MTLHVSARCSTSARTASRQNETRTSTTQQSSSLEMPRGLFPHSLCHAYFHVRYVVQSALLVTIIFRDKITTQDDSRGILLCKGHYGTLTLEIAPVQVVVTMRIPSWVIVPRDESSGASAAIAAAHA